MMKFEDWIEFLKSRDTRKKETNPFVVFLAVIGVIAAICGIVYLLYRHFVPDYLEDLQEDYEDDLDDYFEEEDEEKQPSINEDDSDFWDNW